MKTKRSLFRVLHLVTAVILFPVFAISGEVHLNTGKTTVQAGGNNYRKLVLTSTVSGFSFTGFNSQGGMFFIGTMRALDLLCTDILPVQHNPAEKKLRVCGLPEMEILFENPDIPATMEMKGKEASPCLKSLHRPVDNFKPLPLTDEQVSSSPVNCVAVSDPMFRSAVQPFIAWKNNKGFRAIEGYTNNPAVGATVSGMARTFRIIKQ